MTKKDELLTNIVNLEHSIKVARKEQGDQAVTLAQDEKVRNNLKQLFETVRKQYEEAEVRFRTTKILVSSLNSKIDEDSKYLASLKRQLARLLDSENVIAEFHRQVDEFRQECLDAPWRKENRTDGEGAFSYQIEGAIQAAVSKQALLADKRGLGKSLTSLVWADLIDATKVIIINPSDTMDNFIREIQLWTPHRNAVKLGKMNKAERDFILKMAQGWDHYMLVLNYQAWRKDPELIADLNALKADTLILDEAHEIKNISTLACQGTMDIRFGLNICPGCDDPMPVVITGQPNKVRCLHCDTIDFITEFCSVKNVLPMTGTPILNKPQELFPLLRMIDPANYESEKDYLADFCRKGLDQKWTWQWGAEKKLIEKVGPRFIARDRNTVGLEIPPAKPVDHIITMDEMKEDYPNQHRAYRQARDYAQIVLDPDRKISMSMVHQITVLMRLRQVLIWPAAIHMEVKDPETDLLLFMADLDVHESIKLDRAEKLIREITEEGERVVVFSQFKDGLHVLQNRLGDRSVTYDGSTSDKLKNEIQLDFDPKTVGDKPRWDVGLFNYKAGGTGLNLNAATHLIKLDHEWNPGKEDQSEGRIDRIGTTKAATIHSIEVHPSVDSWMVELLASKRDMLEGFQNEAEIMRKLYDALGSGEI